MSKTETIPQKLLWIDLEMTGLDPEHDVILEVAAEVTGFDFTTIQSFEARIRQPKDLVVKRMQANNWWKDFPENRDSFIDKLNDGVDPGEAEKALIKLVDDNFDGELAILAGNSIHNDRKFIEKWWPNLDLKLHYRMLDVSSFKVFMQGKYGATFEKKEVHRAFDDIQASIAELDYYIDWLKNN